MSRQPVTFAFALVLVPMASWSCPSQGGVLWEPVTPASSPSLRAGHAMAYDARRQRIVLFGGSANRMVLSDTWEWDGVTWTRASPPHRPPARFRHAMAYDAARGRVVLFGGADLQLNEKDDTWEWDGTDWVRAAPARSPAARDEHAMTYDAARQRVVLFGGAVRFGVPVMDTWLWDGVGWVPAVPAHSPPARRGHALAYDAARQRVVLFGGSGFADTWEWDGGDWANVTVLPRPTRRIHHAMAYDEVRGRVVVFAGTGILGPYDDTWEWDGSAWTWLTPTRRPFSRSSHAMVYDVARGHIVMFGGVTVANDTWVLSSASPAVFDPVGNGCRGSGGVPTLGNVLFSYPWTGESFSLELSRLPPRSPTFMVTGLSDTFWTGALLRLPAPLTSWGMPGCTVYTDVVHSELLVNTAGTALWTKTVPADPGLVGMTFYNQAFVADPGANALGATVSNGGGSIVGVR